MLRRSMVEHEIHDDPDAMSLGVFCQTVEVLQRSVHRINVLVVGNIVPKINLRRRIARRNPNSINAEICKVI